MLHVSKTIQTNNKQKDKKVVLQIHVLHLERNKLSGISG